jgi:pimeloyl-ACP methyl ester carboxylesterase
LILTPEQLRRFVAPVLVIHGRKDRSAPYGGGRDWAAHLGNARLLTVADGAHAPWIEAPQVLEAIDAFLVGAWPDGAEQVPIP